MSEQPSPRRRTMSVVIQILAALFVAEVSMKHLPTEVRTHGWSAAALAMVGVCVAIVAVVLWVMFRGYWRAQG